jgi:transcriptional regulator with XRE-family HTH domain
MGLRKFTSKKIGQAIREIRRELNMSQEEFGMAAGSYSQDTVAKWESGQVPHAIVLKSISDLSDPFRNGGKPRKRSISRSVGTDAHGSKRNSLVRKGRHVDSTVRYQTQKEAVSSQNPFEVLTDQLRVLVREEIQAALKKRLGL